MKKAKNLPNKQQEKIPKDNSSSFDKNKVFWSFAYFDSDIEYPSGLRSDLQFSDVADMLKSTGFRGWKELTADSKRDHPIAVNRLAKFAQKRIAQINLDDIDELWSFRVNAAYRIWCIKIESLLQVLWIDPNHQIYPVEKRHT